MNSSIEAYLAQHPTWPQVLKVLKTLIQAGHEAVLAGGCVRDALLKRPFHDFDVATSAKPEQVEALFDKTISVGKAFGVIMVLEEGVKVEVATFRHDGVYSDGRHPDRVEFSSLEEDAKRRDFTVNALFLKTHPRAMVLDFVHGQLDLHKKQISCVGDPQKRFAEDGLRLLRAIRFSVQLQFSIEAKTWQSIKKFSHGLEKVAQERRLEELRKIAVSSQPSLGWELLRQSGLLSFVIPTLSERTKNQENGWKQALLELRRFKAPSPPLAIQLAWLFYRTGETRSEELVHSALQKLKATHAELEDSKQFLLGIKVLCEGRTGLAQKLKIYDSRVGHWLIAFSSFFTPSAILSDVNIAVLRFQQLMDASGHLPKALLRGEDLLALGIPPGVRMGQILTQAYDHQLENNLSYEELIAWVKLRGS